MDLLKCGSIFSTLTFHCFNVLSRKRKFVKNFRQFTAASEHTTVCNLQMLVHFSGEQRTSQAVSYCCQANFTMIFFICSLKAHSVMFANICHPVRLNCTFCSKSPNHIHTVTFVCCHFWPSGARTFIMCHQTANFSSKGRKTSALVCI